MPSDTTVRHEQPVTIQDVSAGHKSGLGSGESYSLSDDKLIHEVMPLIDTDVLGYNTIQAIIYKVPTLLNFQLG